MLRFGKFIYLMVAILLLLIVSPFLRGGGIRGTLLNCLSTGIVLAAIYAVSENRRDTIIALTLGCLGVLIVWYHSVLLDTPSFGIPAAFILLAFYAFAIIVMLRKILRTSTITRDTIFGAISIYLLIGVFFSVAYTFLHYFSQSAFAAGADFIKDKPDTSAFTYFSFVTLTTLGYGDMTPMSPFARTLTIIEAIIGVLYVAVLIARLVGVYISQTVSQR